MAKRTSHNSRRSLSLRQRRAARRRWLIIGAVAALVVAGASITYAYLSRDEPVGKAIADLGNNHLSSEPTSYLWNSRPPTSGPHSQQLARWGEHTETVPEWYQAHNLEDGGVILHYNCPDGCPELVEELRDIVKDVGSDRLILQPYTNMESRIAVTAWTRLLALDEVDRSQIIDFIDAYRGLDHHR